MRRKLFTSCSGLLLLLLFVGAGVLWARSSSQEDFTSFARTYERPPGRTVSDRIYLGSNRGVLCLGRNVLRHDARVQLPKEGLAWTSKPSFQVPWGRTFLESHHFSFNRFDHAGQQMTELYFPHWAVIVVAGLPIVFVASWQTALQLRRKSRLGRSKCGACGYDLRATPDRCPECGAAAAKETA